MKIDHFQIKPEDFTNPTVGVKAGRQFTKQYDTQVALVSCNIINGRVMHPFSAIRWAVKDGTQLTVFLADDVNPMHRYPVDVCVILLGY